MNGESALKQYLDAAIRRWWLILVPFLIGVGGATAYYQRATKLYRASTVIEVQEKRIPSEWFAETVTITIDDRISRIVEILKSDDYLDGIARETEVMTAAASDEERRIVHERLRKALNVSVSPDKTYFEIQVTWPDQNWVAKLATAFSDHFIEEHRELRADQAKHLVKMMVQQAEEAESELREKQEEIADYKRQRAADLPERRDIYYQKIEQAQREIDSLAVSIQGHQDSIKEIEFQRDLGLGVPQPLRVVEVPDGRLELEQKREELQEALTNLGELHPRVKELRRAISTLEKSLGGSEGEETAEASTLPEKSPRERMIEEEIGQTRAQIARAEKRQSGLFLEIQSHQRHIDASGDVALKLDELQRDLESLKDKYIRAKEREEDARSGELLETSGEGETFRVLRPAQRPVGTFRPVLLEVLLLGALGGLAVGAGLIVLLEYVDQSYRSEDQLAADFDLPILATIPNLDVVSSRFRKQQRRARR